MPCWKAPGRRHLPASPIARLASPVKPHFLAQRPPATLHIWAHALLVLSPHCCKFSLPFLLQCIVHQLISSSAIAIFQEIMHLISQLDRRHDAQFAVCFGASACRAAAQTKAQTKGLQNPKWVHSTIHLHYCCNASSHQPELLPLHSTHSCGHMESCRSQELNLKQHYLPAQL